MRKIVRLQLGGCYFFYNKLALQKKEQEDLLQDTLHVNYFSSSYLIV